MMMTMMMMMMKMMVKMKMMMMMIMKMGNLSERVGEGCRATHLDKLPV